MPLRTMRSILEANGRAARIASCDLRMRAAATIFMAFVICSVDFVDLILLRSSLREAIV